MIEWLAAFFLVLGFLTLLHRFKLVTNSKEALRIAGRVAGVIRSPSLSDLEKEKKLQGYAVRMLGCALLILLGGLGAFLVPASLLWLADRLGLLSLPVVFRHTLTAPVLLVGGLLAVVLAGFRENRARGRSPYSMLDRWFHRVAFHSYTAQTVLSDLEDALYSRALSACRVERPVFITALPRAGTTLLLECLAGVPEFASHRYRDMPFVLIPLFWNQFSMHFRKTGTARPRAHGDGMLIDADSPEAFEEVLWKTFWKKHYLRDRILPWGPETDAEFADFLRNHLRKIVWLRRCGTEFPVRYVSKNNLNIARIPLLKKLFPDACIIVPFRRPLHHAASLLEQHRNFLRIHEQDRFAAAYMWSIGHFDFGRNLRPVDFSSWIDGREARSPDELAFWLEYWTAAYGHLAKHHGKAIHLLDYETLCEHPQSSLRALADALGSERGDAILATAGRIRSPRAREIDARAVPGPLREGAGALYREMAAGAVNRFDPA